MRITGLAENFNTTKHEVVADRASQLVSPHGTLESETELILGVGELTGGEATFAKEYATGCVLSAIRKHS